MSKRNPAPGGFGVDDWRELAKREIGSEPEVDAQHRATTYSRLYVQPPQPVNVGVPGQPPYIRGAYATMYTHRPWTLRQYAGFASAVESNAFYKRSLAGGQRGLSVAFDLPTHRGYDSDFPEVAGDVGMAGVAVDSVEDMHALFDGIALGEVSVSMTMSGAVLPILASYVVAAEEQGASRSALQGTLQNDILKEFLVRNTYIFPPEPSMRIVGDILSYCSREMPRFNPISISGYHVQEAGATPGLELGVTLANGLEYIERALQAGLAIDAFASRLSFFFGVGMDLLLEVAKLRGARKLWAELVTERYKPTSPNSARLRMHCQTSGVSLTAQDPLNNVVRTTIEALAAILGGTQSLHTNAFDEAWALPSDEAARVARHTQLILQHETDLCQTVDPLGGSYAIEALTEDVVQQARAFIAEVDAAGGMTRAIEQGWVQQRIEQCSAQRQVRLDRGDEKLVGVNFQRGTSEAPELNVRVVNNSAVLDAQRAALASLRQRRDHERVERSLVELENRAASSETKSGELMDACVVAMRARATVGEVTARLERVWGRHQASTQGVVGVYTRGYEHDADWHAVVGQVLEFERKTGRRPRMLIAKLGQDGHDRGAKVVASGFADAGFDVDLGALFQTPQQVARVAIDNDVHVVGISTQTAAHRTLLPALIEHLRAEGADDILVACGGIVPPQDRPALEQAGVSLIFSPGTPVVESIRTVMTALLERVG